MVVNIINKGFTVMPFQLLQNVVYSDHFAFWELKVFLFFVEYFS